MTLLSLKNIRLRFGGPPLLDGIDFAIARGERVCVLGRNGEGKSTILRLITGQQKADEGEIIRQQTLRVAEMPQELPASLPGDVYDVVAQGAGELGRKIAEYHHLLAHEPDNIARLGKLQDVMDQQDGWSLDARLSSIISRLDLPPDTPFDALSGGLKRRALLGRALASDPDLLLLDEPTNHLDLDSIGWLEDFLANWHGALLFITHDRTFLRRLATRIVELDRGQLTSWPGDYDNYLRRREERLHAEAQHNALFDKNLAKEEKWIRKGVEARRTRDMGRVKRLMEAREQYAQRRNLQGTAQFTLQEAERSGKLVAEAKNVSYSWGDGHPVIKNFTGAIMRGEKIGIVGPNGAGKTTLLNILLGRLQPQSGTLREGSNLQVAWFDQLRAGLKENETVWENIGAGKEFIEINGQRKHVMSYLQEFLFAPDRARSPVHVLSGGERARLLLAQLFSQPANLLVLDEPTNDLDMETLDLLEDLLVDFGGTVLVVSHDRDFLDNVVTRTLAFEGNGRVGDYVGGYQDWLRQRPPLTAKAEPAKPAVAISPPPPPAAGVNNALNSKEKRELHELPALIEKLEAEQGTLGEQLAELYAKDQNKAVETQKRLSAIAEKLAAAYARWEALEARR